MSDHHPLPPRFEKVLRSYLILAEDERLTPESNLTDHGLNSMAAVRLLLDLEARYAVTIPDEQLATLSTANVGRLWEVLAAAGATDDIDSPATANSAPADTDPASSRPDHRLTDNPRNPQRS